MSEELNIENQNNKSKEATNTRNKIALIVDENGFLREQEANEGENTMTDQEKKDDIDFRRNAMHFDPTDY